MKTQRLKDRSEDIFVDREQTGLLAVATGIGFRLVDFSGRGAVSGLPTAWPGPGIRAPAGADGGLDARPESEKGLQHRDPDMPSDLSDGRNIVFKDEEYALRIDWPPEGSRISFYVYGDGQWEPG